MNKKRLLLALCLIVSAAVTFAFSRQAKVKPPQPQSQPIPQHIVYRHVFHHIVLLKEKADSVEKQGKQLEASSLRSFYATQANLSAYQGEKLDEIAAQCDRDVAQQDAEAQKIIESARGQHPGGKLEIGQTPVPPPDLLKVMQEERNDIILRARDRLQAVLGKDDFARFDEYVRTNIAEKLQPVDLKPERPVLPASPRMQSRQVNPQK